MDQNTLVEGDDAGLRAIADEFRKLGFPVEAIYLIKRTSIDGYVAWVVNAVLSPFRPGLDRDFLYQLVRLRREKKLPFIDEQVRVNAVSPDHVEAKRVIEYAQQMGEPPIHIRNVFWDGLYIEYALVAEYDHTTAAAA
jgi:hypothetical protein